MEARGLAAWWRAGPPAPAGPSAVGTLPKGPLAAFARIYLPRSTTCIPGNRCTLLRDGVSAFPAMLEAIRCAQRSIRLETYMLLDDAVGQVFARALREAAARGVEVRVLYDALGSWGLPRAFIADLRAHQVAVRAFRPFGYGTWRRLVHRDHRKLLVVDGGGGGVAFIGGINIAAPWAPLGVGRGWRDDVLQVEGPAVQALERCCRAGWRHQHFRTPVPTRRRAKSGLTRGRPSRSGEIGLLVLGSRRSIHRAYLEALAAARWRVSISAAYFLPDRRLLHALLAAARRGVVVRLILNRWSDHPLLQLASRGLYEQLLAAGVQILEWREGVIHSKTAAVDGIWGTVGSFNLERMSLRFNHEANVAFADPRLARAVERSFEEDCARCTPLTLQAWRSRPWWWKLAERACFLFRKLM